MPEQSGSSKGQGKQPRVRIRAARPKAAAEMGKRLRALREEFSRKRGRPVTLAEVCKAVRAMQAQLSDYENGKRMPSPVMVDRLADFYSVTTDYLIRGSESDRARSRGDRALSDIVALLEKLTPEQLAAVRPTIEALARANEQKRAT